MIILREQKKHTKGVDKEGLQGKQESGPQIKKDAVIGFAVDIGTTTIALAAVECKSGKILGRLSETNKQTKLGADVMMRIMHSLAGRREQLHEIVVSQIEQMSKQILAGKISEGDFDSHQYTFSVVGNTAMCHLFLNKDVTGLAGYPFQMGYMGNYYCTGQEIGMVFFGSARIFVLSNCSSCGK